MISSKEAETMNYYDYKVEFWKRMSAAWTAYGARHPEENWVADRVASADQWIGHWVAERRANLG